MNKFYTFILALVLTATLWAQAPQQFSFQAVVREANNVLVSNKQVGMKISLLKSSETGTAVYEETHTLIANSIGFVSIAIGGGTKVSGDFATIDWANGPYYLKIETDPAGGTNYSLITTNQLLSVPYALFSANSQPGPKGDKGDIGAQGPVGTFPSGTTVGEIKYWDGSDWVSLKPGTNGQGLTLCDGIPTWTTGGSCPSKITNLNCGGVSVNGSMNNGVAVSNVSFVVSYEGGNGGPYSSQNISSTSVLGLTANLQAGSFANGNGSLTFTVSGKPSSEGNALFSLNIAGQICSVSIIVQAQSTDGYGPDVTDAEGNTYKTVTIGTQQWMAENLKVTKYNDGTDITNIADNTQWQNNTTGAWAYYNNDASNNVKYGKLYNWYAVSPTTNGNKNVCPSGWHVPTDTEWSVLTNYLGGESVAGGKMKAVVWDGSMSTPTNTSLFTALPGGYRNNDGGFNDEGYNGSWWSNTEVSTTYALYRYLDSRMANMQGNSISRSLGLSVRCLKD